MKNNKRIIINIIIILFVLCLVLYFSLKDNYQEIISFISSMNYFWLIVSILLFILYRFIIGISYYYVVVNNKTNVSLKNIIKLNFIILFFHGITPFAMGGQPLEIYYLHNEDIPISKATNIVLQNFMIYQSALIMLGIFSLSYNAKYNIFFEDSLIKKLVILGFCINFIILVLSYIVSFSKKTNNFIVGKGINILSKLKLIKDKEKTKENLSKYLANFHDNAITLKNNKKVIFICLILNIFALSILYSVPFSIIKGIGINIKLSYVIVATSYVMIMASFVPIPGSTGGLEYGFVYFFKYLILGSAATAVMLIWRFITYYLGMIIGAIVMMTYRKKE